MKTAFITGITGQDGAYLTRLLLSKGYAVHGMIRRTSWPNTARLELLGLMPENAVNVTLHYGDMNDALRLHELVHTIEPDEVYNLAAQSDVAVSFHTPEYTMNTNALGAMRLLHAVQQLSTRKSVRFYQASTSEIFGHTPAAPQSENTPFIPCSPYGVSKLSAFWFTVNSRKGHGLHASNGILFNHESPIRGEMFVSRKVTRAVNRIASGLQQELLIGNLDAKRDWGHAADYVEGIWRILQHNEPDDYVLATGESHSVRELVTLAFQHAGISLVWSGEGLNETGIDKKTKRVLVRVNPSLLRQTDIAILQGDFAKARKVLSWQPKISFNELVAEMMRTDALTQPQAPHARYL